MTHKARIRIAAAVTCLFLAGLTAAGIASRRDSPDQPATTTAQTGTTTKTMTAVQRSTRAAAAQPAVASAPPAQPVASSPDTESEPHEVHDDEEDRGRGRGRGRGGDGDEWEEAFYD